MLIYVYGQAYNAGGGEQAKLDKLKPAPKAEPAAAPAAAAPQKKEVRV
jgi:hypothetical protein